MTNTIQTIDTPDTDQMARTARRAAMAAEAIWGHAPTLILACAGWSDEHWQLWHPYDTRHGSPSLVVSGDGVHAHPDTHWDVVPILDRIALGAI